MDEFEFREQLTKEELTERGVSLPVKIVDIMVLKKLISLSEEYSRTFDEIVLIALNKLFHDIEVVRGLRY